MQQQSAFFCQGNLTNQRVQTLNFVGKSCSHDFSRGSKPLHFVSLRSRALQILYHDPKYISALPVSEPGEFCSKPVVWIKKHRSSRQSPYPCQQIAERWFRWSVGSTSQAGSRMARVYADVNRQMPRSYWDYHGVSIAWGALENYEVIRKIGMASQWGMRKLPTDPFAHK
jgi:hypothetical protein